MNVLSSKIELYSRILLMVLLVHCLYYQGTH